MKDGTFKIEDYANDKGKALYLFFLKLHTPFQSDSKEEEKAETTEKKESSSEEFPFDVNKKDPFGPIQKKYRAGDINVKRDILEEIWDIILGNTDDVDKPDKALSDSDVSKFNADWNKLNTMGQKVYLYKFCEKKGPDMDQMDIIQDIDVVDTYNELPAEMDDVFQLNKYKQDNGCVIL